MEQPGTRPNCRGEPSNSPVSIMHYMTKTVLFIGLLLIFVCLSSIYRDDNIVLGLKKEQFDGSQKLCDSTGAYCLYANTDVEYKNTTFCDINCETGVPCQYKDEVDFRIIVITYKRPESLMQCLNHVGQIDTRGDKVGVDVWIDRDKDGHVDKRSVEVARNFSRSWTRGRACVHVQKKNAGIRGQWIDTWRPKENTQEMVLFLEDDIDLSPQAYRWLKMVKQHFVNFSDVAGYGIQMENLMTKSGPIRSVHGPTTDVVFLYEQFCTWGYAPVPEFWRKFQVWYHKQRQDPDFHPFVPNIISTKWYKDSIKSHHVENSWELWFTFFKFVHSRYTVFPNLLAYTGRDDVLLDTNRQEKGLHFGAGSKVNHQKHLLRTWKQSFEIFPKHVTRVGFDGQPIGID